jgi:hypothetical protein
LFLAVNDLVEAPDEQADWYSISPQYSKKKAVFRLGKGMIASRQSIARMRASAAFSGSSLFF